MQVTAKPKAVQRTTAGELANKALQDNTKYDAIEVGHAMTDDVDKQLRICIDNHNKIFDEDEYCIVRVIAEDPLIKTLKRFKYYGWLYLPSPRPNQAVFLYNKKQDRITKRLWVLPSPQVMAELASNITVDKKYKTMQAWSVAFFCGNFWEYVRHDQGIDMLSESEYLAAHRDKLINSGCNVIQGKFVDPFDFSKISIEKIVDTQEIVRN